MKSKTYIPPFLLAWTPLLGTGFSFGAIAQIENPNHEYPTAEADLNTARKTIKAYEEENWPEFQSHSKNNAVTYGLGGFDSLDVAQTIGRETAVPHLEEKGTWLETAIPDGPQKGNWIFHWENQYAHAQKWRET